MNRVISALFQDFQRSRAFLYLNEIKRRFLAVFGPGAQTAVAYAMNTEFARVLANEMVMLMENEELKEIEKTSQHSLFHGIFFFFSETL